VRPQKCDFCSDSRADQLNSLDRDRLRRAHSSVSASACFHRDTCDSPARSWCAVSTALARRASSARAFHARSQCEFELHLAGRPEHQQTMRRDERTTEHHAVLMQMRTRIFVPVMDNWWSRWQRAELVLHPLLRCSQPCERATDRAQAARFAMTNLRTSCSQGARACQPWRRRGPVSARSRCQCHRSSDEGRRSAGGVCSKRAGARMWLGAIVRLGRF
jgi:hypothetical protein